MTGTQAPTEQQAPPWSRSAVPHTYPPRSPLPQQNNNSARYQNGSQKYPQMPKIKPNQVVRVDVDMDAGTAVFTVDGEKVPNNPVFDNLAGQTVWPCVLMYTPNRQVTIVKVGKVGGGGGGGMTSVRSSWRKLVVVSFCFWCVPQCVTRPLCLLCVLSSKRSLCVSWMR